MFDCCCINKWFESRTYLSCSLRYVIVLKIFVIDSTNPGFYITRLWFHSHQSRLQKVFVIANRIHRTHGRIFLVAGTAIDEHLHLRRFLHLTPQTISAQIKLFEEELGATLLRPAGRGLELTEAGRVALSYADEMFALGDELQASHPLRDAKVVVEDIEDNPGFFRVKLYAVPHFQVEGMDVNLSLVSQMPKAKA